MASEELIKFDKEFPNSKYREIHAQYTGPMDSDADKEKYQKYILHLFYYLYL